MGYEKKDNEKVFLAYLDERNKIREGYFKVIHIDSSFCKFETANNIITIPSSRILKIKEVKKDGESY